MDFLLGHRDLVNKRGAQIVVWLKALWHLAEFFVAARTQSNCAVGRQVARDVAQFKPHLLKFLCNTLGTRRKWGRVNFRKDFWDGYDVWGGY